ncbi:thioredoxin family protein [Rhodococcus antarcticus]|uniref:Thioredoxin family protein n=1 Tax=Rhodococcus antarcticus TaxID=2987751 RepID=A0ABY6P1G1_9NOCA|nr:thioredoxin family protein [Rhodococcus antarcticus]UZJ25484.1 thioredoxin family protein [Rhodococcus antarcticus]
MDVTLLYFEGCPHWELADSHLAALAAERGDLTVTRRLVETAEEAERVGFLGSPSIQVDGVDVFAGPGSLVGLTCRRYVTPDGVAGAPTLDQLRSVLTGA